MAKLYVGNLNFETTEDDLRSFFAEVGEVGSVNVIRDKFTGRSRGFAFVEIDDSLSSKAIGELNGRPLQGRNLKVNEAKPQEPRQGGGGSGGGGGRRRF